MSSPAGKSTGTKIESDQKSVGSDLSDGWCIVADEISDAESVDVLTDPPSDDHQTDQSEVIQEAEENDEERLSDQLQSSDGSSTITEMQKSTLTVTDSPEPLNHIEEQKTDTMVDKVEDIRSPILYDNQYIHQFVDYCKQLTTSVYAEPALLFSLVVGLVLSVGFLFTNSHDVNPQDFHGLSKDVISEVDIGALLSDVQLFQQETKRLKKEVEVLSKALQAATEGSPIKQKLLVDLDGNTASVIPEINVPVRPAEPEEPLSPLATVLDKLQTELDPSRKITSSPTSPSLTHLQSILTALSEFGEPGQNLATSHLLSQLSSNLNLLATLSSHPNLGVQFRKIHEHLASRHVPILENRAKLMTREIHRQLKLIENDLAEVDSQYLKRVCQVIGDTKLNAQECSKFQFFNKPADKCKTKECKNKTEKVKNPEKPLKKCDENYKCYPDKKKVKAQENGKYIQSDYQKSKSKDKFQEKKEKSREEQYRKVSDSKQTRGDVVTNGYPSSQNNTRPSDFSDDVNNTPSSSSSSVNPQDESWYLNRAKLRSQVRHKQSLSDWLFERSKARQLAKNQAQWTFDRASAREFCRSYRHNLWCTSTGLNIN